MDSKAFEPTPQQTTIVERDGPAFVKACPGAGKTRTMVSRAQRVLSDKADRRGVAFLSFTNAAIDELQTRLASFGVLPNPIFPSYLGTFDSFLWQFIMTPLGIPGSAAPPRLVPDKNEWEIKPNYHGAQALPLKCFDRKTGTAIAALCSKKGFDISERSIASHEGVARATIQQSRSNGFLDFDDVRVCVETHLSDSALEKRIGIALGARFREVIIDEAQDCNPADLAIIDRFRNAGIPVKVICDPDQAIYAFRGGVTNEFQAFASSFNADQHLPMTGNFRSTPAICKAISALRPSSPLATPDVPLGPLKADPTPVHIIAYPGTAVHATIGSIFGDLVNELAIPLSDAIVLASTWSSGAKAIGQAYVDAKDNKTVNLAMAVMDYHFAFAVGGVRDALVELHKTVLWVQGHIAGRGDYHRYIQDAGLDDGRWRPAFITLAKALRFNNGDTADAWLQKARTALTPGDVGTTPLGNRLKTSPDLPKALSTPPTTSASARTIHSAKGLEFPAVCVVMTKSSGKILDHLEGTRMPDVEEDARKIYVAASRAQRLLAIAVPASQAARLQAHLAKAGTSIVLHKIT